MQKYPLIVIGAGAAGLVIAIGMAKAGKKVLLIERGNYGGDCTNFGCIPSKSLIASAEIGYCVKNAKKWGLDLSSDTFKGKKALERVRRIVEEVRSHEDPEALKKAGVETLTGLAEFEDPHLIKITEKNDNILKVFGKKIVIAAGSSPSIPSIEGLKETPYLTNETIFDLQEIPKRLIVIGAGPIGCELAHAFLRLGSEVTLIKSERGILPKEEPLVQKVLEKQFLDEGMQIFTRCSTNRISYERGKFSFFANENFTVESEQILVAVGRVPNVADLQLEKAGIHYSLKGISVDKYGRTSAKHIFAVGDIVGEPFFTHFAENQARSVLTTLFLPSPFKKQLDRKQALPHVTFTDPEVASLGMKEKEASDKYGASKIASYLIPFTEVDRAITTGREEGFVKIITKKWSSQILGATIVGPRAGEMILQISTAMLGKIPLRKLSALIHPYPTYSGAIRKAADQWLTHVILPNIKKVFK